MVIRNLTGTQRLQVLLCEQLQPTWNLICGGTNTGEQQVDSGSLDDWFIQLVFLGYRWCCGNLTLWHFLIEIRSLNLCNSTKRDQEEGAQCINYTWCSQCEMTVFRLNCKSVHYSCCICSTSLAEIYSVHLGTSLLKLRSRNPCFSFFLFFFLCEGKGIKNLKWCNFPPKMIFVFKSISTVSSKQRQEVALADRPQLDHCIGITLLSLALIRQVRQRKQRLDEKSGGRRRHDTVRQHCHDNNLLSRLLTQPHPQGLGRADFVISANAARAVSSSPARRLSRQRATSVGL